MKDILNGIIEDKEISTWHILVLLTSVEITIVFLFNTYILTRETYGVILSDDLDIASIDDFYILAKKMSYWGYLFSPLLLLLRVILVSLFIQLFFMITLKEISFKKLFRLILIGYGIFILLSFTKFCILLITPLDEMSGELLSMIPLSISGLLYPEHISELARGILNNINVFELFWLVIVIFGLKVIGRIPLKNSSIVAIFVWILIFMFKAGVNLYLYKIFES